MSTFINPTELDLKEETVVCINRVSKATTGGRRMRFRCIVVIGDGNSHVGIGYGRANEVASAVNKAKESAKKQIFKYNQGEQPTPEENQIVKERNQTTKIISRLN